MSKKILFFSKGQRIAIITLLSLIIIIIIADLTLSKWAPQPQSFYNETFQKEIEAFEEQIKIAKTKEDFIKSEKETSTIIIELNAADTTQLATIMKKSLAKRIIGYRKALGGFHSIEQLGEVYNITEKELNDITPHITLDLSLIQQINVNKATVEQLKRHPYLNFYQAKAICELRKAKKHLSSIEDISILEEFSKSDITKITPYLNFKQ